MDGDNLKTVLSNKINSEALNPMALQHLKISPN